MRQRAVDDLGGAGSICMCDYGTAQWKSGEPYFLERGVYSRDCFGPGGMTSGRPPLRNPIDHCKEGTHGAAA